MDSPLLEKDGYALTNARPVPRRPYQVVARQILALIEERKIEPGRKIPTERQIAELLGTRRPAVREAMIALETAGILEVRLGDGSYLKATPEFSRLAPWLLESEHGPGPLEQFEARRAIEPAAAAMAAVAAPESKIGTLERLIDEMTEVMPQLGDFEDRLGYRFHVTLAELSGNMILAATVRHLWDLREGEMWRNLRRRVITKANRKRVIQDRREIVKAIRTRDPSRARAAMSGLLERAGRRYFGLDQE